MYWILRTRLAGKAVESVEVDVVFGDTEAPEATWHRVARVMAENSEPRRE